MNLLLNSVFVLIKVSNVQVATESAHFASASACVVCEKKSLMASFENLIDIEN